MTQNGKAALILIIFGSLVYGRALQNGFVYDDHPQIEKNPYLLELKHLPNYFVHPFWSMAAQINPHAPFPYRNLGVALHTEGQSTEAREAFAVALTLSPDHPRGEKVLLKSIHSLAALDYQEGDLENSLRHYRTLTRLEPTSPLYWNLAAQTLVALGKCEGLQALVAQAKRKCPRPIDWRDFLSACRKN